MPTELSAILARNRLHFGQLLDFNAASDRLLAMELTGANPELEPGLLADTSRFAAWVTARIRQAGARYAVGGYDELRLLYSRSAVFDPAEEGLEPRRLHLGTDIWGPAGTEIRSFLDGRVHSFAFNNRFGDYGATILLSHRLENQVFHSLYGHLSLQDLAPLKAGMPVAAGQIIGHFGKPEENGSWPPHLHLQLIEDLEDWSGDYPGVCRLSERVRYLSNCPDPDLVLNWNQYLVHPEGRK